MAHLVTFRTTRFDPAAEPANPINPIAGHAVLLWLRKPLRIAGFQSGETEPVETGPIDWTIQIHRQRSLSDKLLGRNTHAADDAPTVLVERLVRTESGFEDIEVDRAE